MWRWKEWSEWVHFMALVPLGGCRDTNFALQNRHAENAKAITAVTEIECVSPKPGE